MALSTQRTSDSGGFTLLELIVVVTILGIMSMAVVPLFHDSIGSIQSDHAVRDFVASVRYAQERAISDAREYRIYLDSENRKYWIASLVAIKGMDKVFEPIAERHGEPMVLPDRLAMRQIKARKEAHTGLRYIGFLPNGACDKASVTLNDKKGRSVTISTNATFGELKVKST